MRRYSLQFYNVGNICKMSLSWAVVVAQLVERLLPTPEVRGSNPVIGKKLYWTFNVNCFEKTKIKKKEAIGHFCEEKTNLF